MLILYWFVFLVAIWLKTYLNEIRVDRWFSKDLGIRGYFLGAFSGAITPFCSCTTVPVFIAMIEGDIRLGYAMSFLISSPTLNLPVIILFYALFGGKLTLVYVTACFLIAVIGGVILGSDKLRRYLLEILFITPEQPQFRLREVNMQYIRFIPSFIPVVIVAAAIATWLKGWVPSSVLLGFLENNLGIAIPGAVAVGGAIYADIGILVPIGDLFLSKGLDTGLIFAFMMAASGVGLPSMILLTKIFKKQLLGMYLITIFLLFTLTGFLVSFTFS